MAAPNAQSAQVTCMLPPSVAVIADRKCPSASLGSPIRMVTHPGSPGPAGKHNEILSPPSLTEKRAQTNGHPSPSRLPANNHNNNNHSDKQYAEGYLKSDDRMRLAKERREERDKGLVAREQAIKEKDRRARLQYERTVEERWRRLEEQRHKEELRRAAVEEKRRLRLEEEKERLEALMKRSLERSLQLEQRPRRWMWGTAAASHGDSENALLPLAAASAFPHDLAAPLPAVSESAPCSPHRSPYRGSPGRADRHRVGLQGCPEESVRGSQSTPNTPKKERLRRERRTASPAMVSTVRRAESPATLSRHPASPKLISKSRGRSPNAVRQYNFSPVRHRPNPADVDQDKKGEDKKNLDATRVENKGHHHTDKLLVRCESPVKRKADAHSLEKSSPAETPERRILNAATPEKRPSKVENVSTIQTKEETLEIKDSPERESNKMGTPVKKTPKPTSNEKDKSTDAEKSTDELTSPVTPTGKAVAGTTNAEEASRLLAERRRQARVQKELEEKQRHEKEEEERRKAEQLKKRLVEERARQEEETQRVNEQNKQEVLHRKNEHEEIQQVQLDKEKEDAEIHAQQDADRHRQEREIQKVQEEEERHQRKKRIEEIMKRTRKTEAELKQTEEAQAVSPPGEGWMNTQTITGFNVEATLKVESQVKGEFITQGSKQGSVPVKVAAQEQAHGDNQGKAKANGKVCNEGTPVKSDLTKGTEAKDMTEHVTDHVTDHMTEQKPAPAVTVEDSTQVVKQESAFVKGQVSLQVKTQGRAPLNVKAADQIDQQENTKSLKAKVTKQEHALSMQGQMKKDESPKSSSQPTSAQLENVDSPSQPISAQLENVDSPQVTRKVTTQATNGGGKGGVEASVPSLVVTQTGGLLRPPPRLDVKSGGGASDEVQSMEVSPVSKEELISIPEFSPVNEVQPNIMTNDRALEDLLDLTGHVAFPKLSPLGNQGDCNKNLIGGVCSPCSESQLTQTAPHPAKSSNKLNKQ
ncbi:MAP7 domain-containing protein 2a isoform X3 [Osmerus eperlanus]|uniref:MAP7 domain-containing protein 2a isoform X3 n=1 Tax=Osmerus eperlanus TaxID=29151 RepID=UPI002E14B289